MHLRKKKTFGGTRNAGFIAHSKKEPRPFSLLFSFEQLEPVLTRPSLGAAPSFEDLSSISLARNGKKERKKECLAAKIPFDGFEATSKEEKEEEAKPSCFEPPLSNSPD